MPMPLVYTGAVIAVFVLVFFIKGQTAKNEPQPLPPTPVVPKVEIPAPVAPAPITEAPAPKPNPKPKVEEKISTGASTDPEPVRTPEYTGDRKFIFDAINTERLKAGLPMLERSTTLDKTAASKALDLSTGGKWQHDMNPDGSFNFDRFYTIEFRYHYMSLGENLSKDFSAQQAINAWMQSPTHRANVLDPRFKYTGIAIEGTYIVQHFASGN